MKVFYLLAALILLSVAVCAQRMTDSQLEGFNGKVKAATTWNETITPKPKVPGEREFETDYSFDENGRALTEVTYFAGDRTTYFILDGERVSKSEHFENDPRVKMHLLASIDGPKSKGDSRYDKKYLYHYDSIGRVVEAKELSNEGKQTWLTEYGYGEGTVLAKETNYGEGGKKRWEYTFTNDANGLAIREVDVDFDFDDKKTSVYSYSDYKLDSHGNWTQRKRTSYKDKDAKKIDKIEIEHRQITYYP